MMRKLSPLEHVIDGNIVFVVRVDGAIDEARLRAALARVQRKHPVLRALIRERPDGLYYEADSAGDVPLCMIERRHDDDYRREAWTEREAPFAYDRPQLRVVWLRDARGSDLLFVSSHRICDGMSMLIVVREVLRAIHSDDPLVPYVAPTTRDVIGDYRPERPWRRRAIAGVLNTLLRLVPSSRRPLDNREHHLEWAASPALTQALRDRCRSENASVHAALLAALDRALQAVLGRDKLPAWLESPIDGRRGRLPALGDDHLFFGGGSVKFRSGHDATADFWSRARDVQRSMQAQIAQEVHDIPSRYDFCERIAPPTPGQFRSLVRLGNALRRNGSWNRFALSNLGNLALCDDAPFRVTDFRLYLHAFTVKVLGIVVYALHGRLRFYYIGDETCMTPEQATALRDALMGVLETQVGLAASATSEAFHDAALAR